MTTKKTNAKRPKASDKKRTQANVGSTILYHVTKPDAADAILETGFRDTSGYYLTDQLLSGVWLANVPLGVNEGAPISHVVLEVTLNKAESELADYEWVEEGKVYREWLIPARIVNEGKVKRLLTQEVDALRSPLERGSRPPSTVPEGRTRKSFRPWPGGLRFKRHPDGSTSAVMSNSTATEVGVTYFLAANDLHLVRTHVIASTKRSSVPTIDDLRTQLSGTGLIEAADNRDLKEWIDVFSERKSPPKAMSLVFLETKTGLERLTLKTYISRSSKRKK